VDDPFGHLDATLTGRHVVLEPLRGEHVEGLAAAASLDRSTYGFTVVPDGPESAAEYVAGLCEERRRGQVVAFVQRRPGGEVLGATRFMSLRWYFARPYPDVVEIGGTWLAASAQRTAVNTEAKLLLLAHAFDVYGVGKVDLKTDARNARSIAAMTRLGLTREGVVAQNQPSLVRGEEGTLRDSALFGVTRADWPSLRARLVDRLGRG
jgi:N-acetyltransferase